MDLESLRLEIQVAILSTSPSGVMESKSFKFEFLNGSQFSKTRDAIFHNSSKRCLTYYIEILNVISPLIPPGK